MKPKRIQLKRVKGWRIPKNTVKVDRSTICGNPHIPNGPYVVNAAVMDYKCDILVAMMLKIGGPENPKPYAAQIAKRLPELKGKNVACWCKIGSKCHGDVLLELANL